MLTEYDSEPIRGLPENLPPGEKLLWQGEPQWRSLARRALHVRGLGLYFILLILWRIVSVVADRYTLGAASVAIVIALLLAAAGVGLVLLFAWTVGRTTVYSITNKRVIIRFGIALPMTLNFPFNLIGAAAVKQHGEGTGDIPLTLAGTTDRVSYLVLWPHVRPWHVERPQPMLRSIAGADAVAEILAQALSANGHVSNGHALNGQAVAGQAAFDAPGAASLSVATAPSPAVTA